MSQWKAQEIGKLVEPVVTWNPLKADHDDEFDYIDLSAVEQDTKTITAPKRVLCGDAPSRARQIVSANDVLVSTVRPNLNGVARVPSELDQATASTGFCVLRPCIASLSSSYLFHWVKSPQFVADMTKKATGQSYPAVSDKIISESLIPAPPLPEQIRIAAILDQADALRVKRREALAQLDSLTQSIFIEMFGDPGANPKQWSIQLLSALIKCKPNNGIFKKNDEYGVGLPVVWVGELFKDNVINCSNSQRLVPSERELEQYGLHHGDILFCRSSLKLAGIGYNNVYLGESNKALFECHVIRITPDKNKLDPMFLNFALRMPSQRLKLFKHAKTVTMTTIDQDGLLRVDLPVPPLQLQKLFADKLNAIERLKAIHAKAQVELDTLFASLQHRAFRGEP